MRILIAEDEVSLAKGLKFLLEKNKFSVDIAHNGADALELFGCASYDAVLLDIMMPKISGLEVLAEIRKTGSSVPIMMLTAKSDVEDRVKGLNGGADDYLPKPFATSEFVARVRALTRRSMGYTECVLSFGNVRLDCNRYELSCGEASIRLNNKEFQLAEMFLRHPRFVFSAERLMDRIWGMDSLSDIDVVWTHIGFIRKKLKTIGADIEIRTIRGAGYSLEEIKC